VKKVGRQSESFYIAWDITWTLCNASNHTFYWPVKCIPCSCRVCPRHMGALRWGTRWTRPPTFSDSGDI